MVAKRGGGRKLVRGKRERSPGSVREYLRALGPGLVTGASDDDPSGIATYSQAGAAYGFSFLWTVLLTLPLMTAVQEICDRTALATGKTLGELATARFRSIGRAVVMVLVALLIIANALNVAADLVAVGSGMQLLHAGVDVAVIALWLGHEQVETTQIYLHADMTIKQRALDRTTPPGTRPGPYQPSDSILAFLDAL